MHSDHCLNCNAQLSGNYCASCGQKASTHRLSLAHFLAHDVVHGLWHLDRGILYTLKLLILRPGKTAREYISGKRAGHFNIVTLLILLAGLMFYIESIGATGEPSAIRIGRLDLTEFVHHYGKYILLCVIPMLSLVSLMVFRKAKYNYTEHLLVNSYYLADVILCLLLLDLVDLVTSDYIGDITGFIGLAAIPLILAVVYWQTFRQQYSIGGWIWRFLAQIVLFVFLLLVLLVILALIFNSDPNAEITI